MLQQKRRLLIKLFGFIHLALSIKYIIIVGIDIQNVYDIRVPEDDQVKASIYPGVSTIITSC